MIVADTCVVIWLANDPAALSEAAKDAIVTARKENGLAICDVTLYELAWLIENERIEVEGSLQEFLDEVSRRFIVLPVTPLAARLAAQFPPAYPADPTDRLIGATALGRKVPLITKDRAIRRAKTVETIW